MLVVTTHVSFSTGYVLDPPFGWMFARFDIGVTIFFLLSGFLLYRQWAKRGLTGEARLPTADYLRRRFWRIVPAYWLMLIAVLLTLPTISPDLFQASTHFLFLQIYFPGTQMLGVTQVWSLAVEVAFYLALPIIGWLATRKHTCDVAASTRRQLWIIGTCFAIGVVFTVLRTVGPLAAQLSVGYWLTSFLDWFALGMFIGLVQVRLSQPNPPKAFTWLQGLASDTTTCLIAAGGLFLIACTPVAGTYTLLSSDPLGELIRHFLYPLIAALFLLPGFLNSGSRDTWSRFLLHPGMQFLGLISYGIFLWHLLIRDLIAYYFGIPDFSGGFAWLLPLTVIVTIGIAWLSWLGIEEPATRYSRGPSLWARWKNRGLGEPEPIAQSATTESEANTIAP